MVERKEGAYIFQATLWLFHTGSRATHFAKRERALHVASRCWPDVSEPLQPVDTDPTIPNQVGQGRFTKCTMCTIRVGVGGAKSGRRPQLVASVIDELPLTTRMRDWFSGAMKGASAHAAPACLQLLLGKSRQALHRLLGDGTLFYSLASRMQRTWDRARDEVASQDPSLRRIDVTARRECDGRARAATESEMCALANPVLRQSITSKEETAIFSSMHRRACMYCRHARS